MTDAIEVRDLRVLGVHGVLEEERSRPQPFGLDLDLTLDMAPAGRSDQLAHTVDYGALVEAAAGVVETRSFALLEALAEAVAAELLALDGRITTVAVTVRKLRPPLPRVVGSVGVRLERVRKLEG